MAAKIFRINYKSDFILTLNSDAGWMTPFCIKFWTGAPSQAFFVGWDGETYTHCAPVAGEPTKLLVQFDDHHLPIGDLKFQIAYHFTVADFPNDTEDEVINPANITTEIDGETYQVMLDFTGETAPEIEFSLPAYANEAQRIANEQQRIANEEQRIADEQTRINNEQTRVAQEQTRQQNEAQRIAQESARVSEFSSLKSASEAATRDANNAATLANEKAQLADDKAALADSAATQASLNAVYAHDEGQLAGQKAFEADQATQLATNEASFAHDEGNYAKQQGDYAKEQGDTALADHVRANADHSTAVDDHTQANNDHTRAESDHSTAAADHTTAGNDHTRAESDHGIAADDHTQAGNDHTRAESDHGIVAADHTQAGNDHTRAESDHTRAESDHAAVEVYVDSLGAFDISAYHATGGVLAEYADLTAALGTNGVNIQDALRKGGMSVKFVSSSDHKYVQYRLMSDAFSTTESDWQGVDEEPVAGSNNLVESGGVALEFEGNSIEQPSEQSLTNGYMNGEGAFTYGTNNRFTIVNLSKARGCHITETTSSIIQYAFLKSYTSEQGVFVNGGSRVSGTVSNTEIPADANYLYIYIGTDTTIPVLELPDAKEGVNQKIEDIETEIQNINTAVSEFSGLVEPIEDIINAVDKLNWTDPVYTFEEADESVATLNNNIVLSSNGDSIEFKLLSCSYASFANYKGYAFARGSNTSHIGIGVSTGYLSVRSDDKTWIFSNLSGDYVGKTIKISYENNNICLYINGVLSSTYSGQKTLTLSSFGNGSDYSVYWDGSITNLKINGASYDFNTKATLSNVGVTQDTSFLSPTEKELLYYSSYPIMMAEKKATKLTVYKKLKDNIYVGYPLNYRYASYEQGVYPSFYDNWGIGQLFLASYINNSMQIVVNLFAPAEAEMAISVPRGDGESGNVYVGGSAHGFENIATTNGREFCILIDNMKCGESDVFALKEVNSIHVVQGSNLYQAYTNANPFAYVTKKWDFEKECNFNITSKVKILSNIEIKYAQLGMFGVYRHYAGDTQNDYLTNKAIKNSQPYKVYEIDDDWWNDPDNAPLKLPDFDCTKITEYGDYNLGFALIVKDANTKESGGLFVVTNNNSYNKIYYSVCNNYNAVIDEVLEGTQEWSIEGNINSLT